MRQTMKSAEAKLTVAVVSMLAAMPAHAAGLQRATSAINSITGDVKVMIPALAALVLACLAIAWSAKWIRFVTLLQWGAGVILAGSTTEVVAMLLG